jgi:CubicO group peptidase (beta-lactamase class C family)
MQGGKEMKRTSIIGVACSIALMAGTPAVVEMNAVVLAKIKSRMQEFVDHGTAAGIVTLVARRDRVVELDAVGWQDRDARIPMRTTSIFQIMSMTKPITCAAVMTLADEGRISINDPVEKYLPEFK